MTMALAPRALFGALALFAATASVSPAIAQSQSPSPIIAPNDVPDSQKPWLFRGSDIPPDPSWRFGVLANGLRYAVRRNDVPPGQVSIRIRIDAGSLMERDDERGYAHLLEHLTFRGSAYAGDLESKRIWQRLGVTFGADSNAATSYTDTVYQLDLPAANPGSLGESMHLLAGMMRAPDTGQEAIDAERPVVLAEKREQPEAQVALDELRSALFFRGERYANRSPMGTLAALRSATPASVGAFHDRWYRPERTVIVMSGDMDPAAMIAAITQHFGDWKGKGEAAATPDFGAPVAGGKATASLSRPSLPPLVTLAYIRPWTLRDDTILFNQKRMVDMLALRMVNRRLESRARSGANFVSAGASLDDVSRSANITSVDILPVGDDWTKALREVRAVIADATRNPPSREAIDREVAEVEAAMRQGVDTKATEEDAQQADHLVEAVDVHETLASPETSLAMYRDAVARHFFTPAAILAASKRVFAGVATRAIVNIPKPDPKADAELAAALSADVSDLPIARATRTKVSFDDLPPLGAPGKVSARRQVVADPETEMVTFANGVRLLVSPNKSQPGKIFVRVRFGRGYQAIGSDAVTPAWAGELALVPSGIAGLDQNALDRLTGDRRIGMDFSIADDAFVFDAQTDRTDLRDQLKLIAQKLAHPRWDANPVLRARAVALAGYRSMAASPSGVLSRDLQGLLRAGDPRWTTPTPDGIAALTPAAFRAFWEPLLKSGPIEVELFGDGDADAMIEAARGTFGALSPRAPAKPVSAPIRFPAHVDTPVVLHHDGSADQAAAVIAWPTGGGSDDIVQGRRLETLAAIFRDRLLDQLRSQAGASYSPNVVENWPVGLPGGGVFLAVGQVPPAKTALFFGIARSIAADLVAEPVSADELRRAIVPLGETLTRSSTGNQFWMDQLAGGTRDPARIAAIDTIAGDYLDATPQSVQALAKRYLDPAREWSLVVLPEAKAGDQPR